MEPKPDPEIPDPDSDSERSSTPSWYRREKARRKALAHEKTETARKSRKKANDGGVDTGWLSNFSMPEISMPDIKMPEIKMPHIEIPEIKMPHIEMPHVEMPHIEMPHIEMPNIEMPQIKLPHIGMPDIKFPEIKMPHIKMPDMRMPNVKMPHLRMPTVAMPTITLPAITMPKMPKMPKMPTLTWPFVSHVDGDPENPDGDGMGRGFFFRRIKPRKLVFVPEVLKPSDTHCCCGIFRFVNDFDCSKRFKNRQFAEGCHGVTYALIIFLHVMVTLINYTPKGRTFWVNCLFWGNGSTYILLYFYSYSAYGETNRKTFKLVLLLYHDSSVYSSLAPFRMTFQNDTRAMKQ